MKVDPTQKWIIQSSAEKGGGKEGGACEQLRPQLPVPRHTSSSTTGEEWSRKYFYRGGSELTAQWIQQLFRQRKLIVPLHRSTPINIVKSERKEKRCTKVKKMIKEVKTERDWKHEMTLMTFKGFNHLQPHPSHRRKFICKSLEPIFCGNEQLNPISCSK